MTLYDRAFVTLAASADAGRTLRSRPTASVHRSNPLCGDEIELDVIVEAERVREVAHRTDGCAITRASAALLAELVPGLTAADAHGLADNLEAGLARQRPLPVRLAALAEVRLLPSRRRCALLPWSALVEALGPNGTART